MDDRGFKSFGKDASVAPSTLEKGVEPLELKERRVRSRRSSAVSSRQVNKFVWAVTRTIKARMNYPDVYVESDDTVWLLNKPADQVAWMYPHVHGNDGGSDE